MSRRFVSIWFRHLKTDRWILHQPDFKDVPFVLAMPDHGRMVVTAANIPAESFGIEKGDVVADARAILPTLLVFDDKPELGEKLLTSLAIWCLRYTPITAIDPPDGLMLDVSGCAHLWGGERAYLNDLILKLNQKGFNVNAAMADTIGSAWAANHYAPDATIVETGNQANALLSLPPAALRLEPVTLQRMQKLGFYQIRNFMGITRSVLRRRFGQFLLERLDQALGASIEMIVPVQPAIQYHERLPCLEPIVTATGIKIALKRLLEILCKRFIAEGVGLRKGIFKGYRMDGKQEQIEIVTNRGSCHVEHLFKLFELKINTIEPDLGIELFILEAPEVEEIIASQESLWTTNGIQDNVAIAELLDRLAGRTGMNIINRYLPQEHHWPERSVKIAESFLEKTSTRWRTDIPRPIHLLPQPEVITVTAPIPDYAPILFRYKGKVHHVNKADGPERIEREWWLEGGLHRDYYCVEDQDGARYWVFRLGHYNESRPDWFIHGFFV